VILDETIVVAHGLGPINAAEWGAVKRQRWIFLASAGTALYRSLCG
jgi:hypothetical protein